MAKKKNVKKEIKNEEIESDTVEKIDEIIDDSNIDTNIEPIDMDKVSNEIDEMKKEIFEEPKNEDVKHVEDKKSSDEKVIKHNKMTNKLSEMFGFVWNGQEYD